MSRFEETRDFEENFSFSSRMNQILQAYSFSLLKIQNVEKKIHFLLSILPSISLPILVRNHILLFGLLLTSKNSCSLLEPENRSRQFSFYFSKLEKRIIHFSFSSRFDFYASCQCLYLRPRGADQTIGGKGTIHGLRLPRLSGLRDSQNSETPGLY